MGGLVVMVMVVVLVVLVVVLVMSSKFFKCKTLHSCHNVLTVR